MVSQDSYSPQEMWPLVRQHFFHLALCPTQIPGAVQVPRFAALAGFQILPAGLAVGAAAADLLCIVHCDELVDISNCSDTPQSRGYALERYLNKLFEAHGLEPRGSFKIVGEQIDGSFLLYKEVYLLEAKWTNKKIDKGDLVIFNEKVSSKSGFTRGLFISYAGFTDEALATFSHGRTVNTILMTVQDLSIALERKLDLTSVLWKKVRALAEEGNFNKSIFDM